MSERLVSTHGSDLRILTRLVQRGKHNIEIKLLMEHCQ